MSEKTDRHYLKVSYAGVVSQYVHAFCEMYDFDYDDGYWVGEDVGGVWDIAGELCFGFDDIRYCVDNDVKREDLMSWYDYTLRVGAISPNLTSPNLHSWVHGCPRIPEDRLAKIEERIRDLHATIDKLEKEDGEGHY